MSNSYPKAIDVTSALTAVGAGNTLDLVSGKPYPLVPQAIMIMDATETIERIDGTPLQGDTVVSFFLKTNVVHEIAFKSLEYDNKTAKAIVILGDNI